MPRHADCMLPELNNLLISTADVSLCGIVRSLSPTQSPGLWEPVSPFECLLKHVQLLIQLGVLLPLRGDLAHCVQDSRMVATAK
mgnify:CR=1 FL=1